MCRILSLPYRISLVVSVLCFILMSGTESLHAQSKDGKVHTPEEFSDSYIVIQSAEVSGNAKTKDRIIIRELDFKIGDSLATLDSRRSFSFNQKRFFKSDSSEVIRRLTYSRENIINTQLFLSVDLYLEQIQGRNYKIKIEVTERWYFWVFPVIKLDAPNFNDWLQDPDLSLLNQGVFTSHNNMWGLSHQGSVIATFGSSTALGIGYYIPWIGKGRKIGMRTGIIYKNSAVVEYGSLDNERQMLYDSDAETRYMFGTTFTIRPGLYNYASVRVRASYIGVSDSLLSLTPNYLPEGKSDVGLMSLYFDYYYDSRNNKAYPLKGNYLKAFVHKQGMGIISHDVDYFFYGIDFHFYQKLNDRFYVAEMLKLSKSSSINIPYYFQQTLNSGDDFIRGYDYYALRGEDLYYFRNNIKYELVKPGVKKARKEKYKDSKFRNVPYAFYLNFFSDAALVTSSFDENLNPYNNRMLYSWGLGLDFISYYDLVLRFEYTFTSINTHGFFFGFGMPV